MAALSYSVIALAMKRESSHYRRMTFQKSFIRPATEGKPDLAHLSAARAQRNLGARKIFVIKQRRRLDSITGASKTIQCILIFDDHPDSLRLVFGRRARRQVNPTAPQSARCWDPILGWMLLMGALIVMFLPLFLKLRS